MDPLIQQSFSRCHPTDPPPHGCNLVHTRILTATLFVVIEKWENMECLPIGGQNKSNYCALIQWKTCRFKKCDIAYMYQYVKSRMQTSIMVCSHSFVLKIHTCLCTCMCPCAHIHTFYLCIFGRVHKDSCCHWGGDQGRRLIFY